MASLFAVLGGAMMICADRNIAYAQNKTRPITKSTLLKGAAVNEKLKLGTSEFIRQIRKRGVDFRLTAAIESELRAAKLRSEVIDAVRANYRGAATPATTTVAGRNQVAKNTAASNRTRNTNSMANSASYEDAGESEDTGEKYDALNQQALTTINKLFVAGTNQQQANAIKVNAEMLAIQMAKLDPLRPEAPKIFAFTAFLFQNYADAENYCQQVIDRGGSVQFDIYHFHGNEPVREVLYISDESVSIESSGLYNVFNYSQIHSVQTKGSIPFGKGSAAVFSMNVTKDNNTYETFFIPAMRGSREDAQLITRIIAKNLPRGR